MANRFGGVSPTYTYALKMRWIVGALCAVVLVLIVLLIGVLKDQGDTPAPSTGQAGSFIPPAPSSPKIDVLVAQSRIEEGARLEKHLLAARPWEPDQLPEGVVLARDEDTILGKFAKGMINANMPLLRAQIADVQPVSALNIPPGFRAVTITVDARSGVEGFAKPNTRVDVLFTFSDQDKKKKVATICRFTKILSVGGQTETPEGRVNVSTNIPVTLLVTERDAKRIELARNLGQLSLALVGGEEERPRGSDDPDTVDITTLTGTGPETNVAEEPSEGVMFTRDPKTGRLVKFKLSRGRWGKDDN